MRGDRGFPDGGRVHGAASSSSATSAARTPTTLPARLASDAIRSTVDASIRVDRREVRPLLLVGKRYEVVVEKDGVALLPRAMLERQGDQVAEAAARHRVLAREQPVVGVHAELVPVGHRLGDEVAAHLARGRRRHGGCKEEPDVRAVARARTLDRDRQPQSPARLHERAYVVPPCASCRSRLPETSRSRRLASDRRPSRAGPSGGRARRRHRRA